jgi:hypothetical protein
MPTATAIASDAPVARVLKAWTCRPWQEADAASLDKRVLNLIDGVGTEQPVIRISGKNALLF